MKTVTYTVSVTPVVLDSTWKKNGTNYVRLRLGLKGSTKLIKTSIVVHKEHYKGGKIIYKPLKTTLDELVLETEKRLTELKSDTLAGMSLDDVERYLATYGKEDEFKLDFYTFADEVIAQKSGQSQKTYQSALNSFKAYINEDTFDISRLTSSLMRDWERWLRSKYGDGARAVSAYTNCIAFIHGQARLKYNDEELGNIRIRNPFQFYKPPRQKASKHRAVEAEFVQKMIAIRSQLKGREKLGVDVFLISFALMGMNCPDLYSCKLDKDDVLHYFRTKTRGRRDDGAEMYVRIEPAIKEIIGEYLSDDKDYEPFYIVQIPPVPQLFKDWDEENTIWRINDIIYEIAHEYSIKLIDFHSAFKTYDDEELFSDGIHPNSQGAELMAKILYPVIDLACRSVFIV